MLERRDLIDRGIYLKAEGGCFGSLCIYVILLLCLQKGLYVAIE